MMNSMKWASALSTRPSLEAAVEDVARQAQQQLQTSADLGLVFISSAFASEFSRLMPLLQERLSVPTLIGCSGGGVVGMNATGQIREVEDDAALSLTLAHLPEVQVHPFQIATDRLPDLDGPPDAWIDLVGVAPQAQPQFILLAEPAASGVNEILQGLDYAYPESVKIGGLAGFNPVAKQGGIFYNHERPGGMVGVALSGNVVLEAIVAQGCRPIGQSYRVVDSERNIVAQLEEQSGNDDSACGLPQTPLEVLQALFQTLNENDRVLAQRSLFVGVAQSAFKQNLEQGDFLIRNLLGVDPRTGAIAIGDRVRPGQRIQFHLRDANASEADLRTLLERYSPQTSAPVGALMFACMGRGEGLYNEPDFDSQLFNQFFPVPVSGFFCNGEIGPVGGTTFLHGYTSVFGICRQRH